MKATQKLVQTLIRNQQSISTAESCTGGRIAALLTAVPGVSATYWAGWVTYTPQAKHQLLGVPKKWTQPKHIVSPQCAQALAESARKKAGATYGLSITGWAGPTRSPDQPQDQPVGLAYVALATAHGTQVRRLLSPTAKNRTRTQAYFARAALRWAYPLIATETAGTALPKRRSPKASRSSST